MRFVDFGIISYIELGLFQKNSSGNINSMIFVEINKYVRLYIAFESFSLANIIAWLCK